MTVIKSLHACTHCKEENHTCYLCYLQTIQQTIASSVIVSNPSMLLYSNTSPSSTLHEFKTLLNDFSSIGGNKQLKQYLSDFIINPSLQQEVFF